MQVNENLFKIIINVGDCVSAGKTDVECLVKNLQLPGTGAWSYCPVRPQFKELAHIVV